MTTNKPTQFILGLNCSSIIHGLRLGPVELVNASLASHAAAHPLETTEHLRHKKLLQDLNKIPEVRLSDALDFFLQKKTPMLKIELSEYEDGRLPIHDAFALLSILAAENPTEVLEIGTYMGYTTKAMAENLPDAVIHTVDLPLNFYEPEKANPELPKDDFHLIRRRVVGREFKGTPVESRIKQHFGDTAQIDFGVFGSANFFFIDGSHTYEYCKQDSEKCLNLCKGAGTFVWHDCDDGHPGVVKFVNKWRSAGRDIRRIRGTSIAYWKSNALSRA